MNVPAEGLVLGGQKLSEQLCLTSACRADFPIRGFSDVMEMQQNVINGRNNITSHLVFTTHHAQNKPVSRTTELELICVSVSVFLYLYGGPNVPTCSNI